MMLCISMPSSMMVPGLCCGLLWSIYVVVYLSLENQLLWHDLPLRSLLSTSTTKACLYFGFAKNCAVWIFLMCFDPFGDGSAVRYKMTLWMVLFAAPLGHWMLFDAFACFSTCFSTLFDALWCPSMLFDASPCIPTSFDALWCFSMLFDALRRCCGCFPWFPCLSILFPTCQVRVVRFYVSCLVLLLLLSSPPPLVVLLLSLSSSSSCSTATRDPQCSLSDLNHDHPRPVFPAGPQPRPSPPSVPCRTSTTTIHAQCSLPDLNREYPRPVFPAGPQPRPSTPSVPCRTSTASIHAKRYAT